MTNLPTATFGRVMTAMVTPLTADLEVDIDGAVALAQWLADEGTQGLVIAGTTGESPVLTDPERLDVIRAIAEAVTIPVVAGTTTNDTPHSIALTKAVDQMTGVAGILAVTPYYNKPSQAGLAAHFTAVAEATKLPVMLYDIPGRTNKKIETDTIVQLAHEVPNIMSVKDAAGNPAETARMLSLAPDGFEVYSGDDGLTLPLLAVGAVGVVSVATHWASAETAAMIDAFDQGDLATARRINARLQESFAFESTLEAPNPLPAKAMLRSMGHDVGQCRLPMGEAPDGLEARAREVLKNLRGA